jgi:hypothetical protein
VIDPGLVGPLAIAAVVAVVVVAFVHRASTALVGSRREERARDEALSLWERADAALRILEDRADELRRGTATPADTVPALDEQIAELRLVAHEVARAGSAPGLRGLGPEVARAIDAADEMRRGCTVEPPGPEARRSVKHGYIELVHAREAVVRGLAEPAAATGPPGAPGPRR